jgi:hypothetical protein
MIFLSSIHFTLPKKPADFNAPVAAGLFEYIGGIKPHCTLGFYCHYKQLEPFKQASAF